MVALCIGSSCNSVSTSSTADAGAPQHNRGLLEKCPAWILRIRPWCVDDTNAGDPHNMTYSTTPADQASTATPYASPQIISGATNSGDPTCSSSPHNPPTGTTAARPKSQSLQQLPSLNLPGAVRTTFSHLTSRCTTCLWWQNLSADTIPRKPAATSATGSPNSPQLYFSMWSIKSPPPQNSVQTTTTRSVTILATTFTMFGCRKAL
mmetsp:Transcript_33386/g.72949  ORF Transcript_33386/g.72949 Transcript_33386/m.72949 type:complete len:207 (-) Transcript_33386:526-1146(-)